MSCALDALARSLNLMLIFGHIQLVSHIGLANSFLCEIFSGAAPVAWQLRARAIRPNERAACRLMLPDGSPQPLELLTSESSSGSDGRASERAIVVCGSKLRVDLTLASEKATEREREPLFPLRKHARVTYVMCLEVAS